MPEEEELQHVLSMVVSTLEGMWKLFQGLGKLKDTCSLDFSINFRSVTLSQNIAISQATLANNWLLPPGSDLDLERVPWAGCTSIAWGKVILWHFCFLRA